MIESRKASKEFANWIDNLLYVYADRHRVEWQDRENYIAFNGFFITFSFDQEAIRRRKSALNASSVRTLSAEFYNVDRFYKKVLRGLLGRKYAEKRDNQPLMIAAADVNGTRVSVRPELLENVHIHSIWLFPAGKKDRLLQEVIRVKNDPRFDFRDIDVREIDRIHRFAANEPSKLASYTAKFLGSNASDMRLTDDLRIYPLDVDGKALVKFNDARRNPAVVN